MQTRTITASVEHARVATAMADTYAEEPLNQFAVKITATFRLKSQADAWVEEYDISEPEPDKPAPKAKAKAKATAPKA